MIPNLVNGCVAHTQIKMYEFERSFSGSKDLSIYNDSIGKNPHSFSSRLTIVPIAVFDFILEDLRPLLLVIESVVFAAFNFLSVPFRLLFQGGGEAKRALRCTMFNVNQAVGSMALAIVQIPSSVVFLFAQLGITLAKPQEAFPSRVQFNPKWLAERHNMDYREILNPLQETRSFVEPYFDFVQDVLFRIERDAACEHPRTTKLAMIPLAAPLALIDASVEVIRPLVMAVGYIAVTALTLIFILFDAIVLDYEGGFNDLNQTFAYLHAAMDALAQTIGNIVMVPITLLSQTFLILWDPRNVMPSRLGLYDLQHQDRLLTTSGTKLILVDSRHNLTNIKSADL